MSNPVTADSSLDHCRETVDAFCTALRPRPPRTSPPTDAPPPAGAEPPDLEGPEAPQPPDDDALERARLAAMLEKTLRAMSDQIQILTTRNLELTRQIDELKKRVLL